MQIPHKEQDLEVVRTQWLVTRRNLILVQIFLFFLEREKYLGKITQHSLKIYWYFIYLEIHLG